jgi:hypothetical protein
MGCRQKSMGYKKYDIFYSQLAKLALVGGKIWGNNLSVISFDEYLTNRYC